MSYIEIFILAIALSVDACVVSFTYALKLKGAHFKNSFLLSLYTSLFQILMPAIGYFMTNFVKVYIEPYSKFIVFLIFSYLGIKFILEANKESKSRNVIIDTKTLILIGIATSIDAFSSGISLSLFGNKILKPAILIGLITFINSNLGYYSGIKLKKLPSKSLEISGGVLLIILGIKALF